MNKKRENNESMKSPSIIFGNNPLIYSSQKNVVESKNLIKNTNTQKLNSGKNQTKINFNNIINLNISCRKYNNHLEGFLNNYKLNEDKNEKKNNIKDKYNKRNNLSDFDNVFNSKENYTIFKNTNKGSNKLNNKYNKYQQELSHSENHNNHIKNKLNKKKFLNFISSYKNNKSLDDNLYKITNKEKEKQKSFYNQIMNVPSLRQFNNSKKSKFNLWKSRNNKSFNVDILNNNYNIKNKTEIMNKNLHKIRNNNIHKFSLNHLSINESFNNKNKLYKKYSCYDKIPINIDNYKTRSGKNINIKKYLTYENETIKENNNYLTPYKNIKISNILDNIKSKYEYKENKHINKQKEMTNEIQILKEKLKLYSEKNCLMQKEINDLKKNINNKNNNNKNISNNYNDEIKNNDNNNINMFQLKLNNIIEKYSYKKNNIDDYLNKNKDINNNTIDNSNVNINPINKVCNINLVNKLFDIFNLGNISDLNKKDFVLNEQINGKINENLIEDNYEKIFENNPQLKYFINVLCEKLKEEKDYREKLEEKTMEIFNNDIKTIDILEKKLKVYESNQKYNLKNNKLNGNSELNNNEFNDI